MYIQHSDLVTPTGNIKEDSDNISEKLKVHATLLKEEERYKTVKKRWTDYAGKANIQYK